MRSPDEMKAIIELARDSGCQKVYIDGIEFDVRQAAPPAPPSEPVPELPAEEILKPMNPLDDLTEDEIKYWATPRYDEIQEEKAKRQQALKEEAQKDGQ